MANLGAQESKKEVADLRDSPQSVNLLAGHELIVQMPDMVLVTTDALAGISWTGPAIIVIDGRPSARITLPTASAAFPRRPIWPYVAAGGLGLLLGGYAGASIAHALK